MTEFSPSDYQLALKDWQDLGLTWEYTGRKHDEIIIAALTHAALSAKESTSLIHENVWNKVKQDWPVCYSDGTISREMEDRNG